MVIVRYEIDLIRPHKSVQMVTAKALVVRQHVEHLKQLNLNVLATVVHGVQSLESNKDVSTLFWASP